MKKLRRRLWVEDESVEEGKDLRASEAVGDWIDALEKVDNEIVRLAGDLRRSGLGKDQNLKSIREHFKGMRKSSLELLKSVSGV